VRAAPPPAPAVTNAFPVTPPPVLAPTLSASSGTAVPASIAPAIPAWLILAPMFTLASLGGFLLYQTGLTRAKNCAHTATLLLVGVIFAWTGYWMGGFAVQTGGIGDAHAALAQPLVIVEKTALDHELGFMALGHHWGLMGSSGFFLMAEENARAGTAALFLGQAVLLAIAIAAALGAGLERGRLFALAVGAFLIGALIYPLFANWVWGGGWLAELGREFNLGHGFLDLGGAGVVHETAGTIALVIAIVLGPRHGRFVRGQTPRAIPGHNVPFVILGTLILFVSWTATNAFAGANPASTDLSGAGLAAVNALLAGTGGLLLSFLLAAWRRRRPEPAVLCRGLLGGVVSILACGALIDPWAAFVIGAISGLLVQGFAHFLERRGIDDPVGAASIHGIGGGWGVLALGFFANSTDGHGLNGIDKPVQGLLLSGHAGQLAAQAIGAAVDFAVVFVLGYICLVLVHKILGNRVDREDEVHGLDWPQVGAFGYQSDIEPE
jgi:Amt family ammonium transporter